MPPKKSKKQRKSPSFNIIDDPNSQQQSYNQLASNNSSSIINHSHNEQQRHQNQHQSSSQQLTTVQANVIKIKATPKTIVFEDEQQQEIEKEIERTREREKYGDSKIDSNHISTIPEDEHQQENDCKKEADTTNNESGRTEIKQEQERRVKSQEYEEKMMTQHYSYKGQSSQEEEDEGQQQQEQQQEEMKEKGQDAKARRRVVQVQKKFVAESLEDLVFATIPPNCTICCAVTFNHQWLSTTRKYNLYLVKQKKFLYSAQKSRLSFTSQFVFHKSSKKKSQPLGNLKSNFTGLEYVLNRIHTEQNKRVSEQCWVGYDFNMLGLSPQRNITVLKNVNAKLEKIPFFSQIKNYYDSGITSKFLKFTNKKATQNLKGEYQLDFHGKVSGPSSKNFILINQKDKETILFGKRKDNTFILQIGHPFSIFEGFGIAVSSLDHKLCVR